MAMECRFDSLGRSASEDAASLMPHSNTADCASAKIEIGGCGPKNSPTEMIAARVNEKKLAVLGEGTRHDVCASTFSPRSEPLPGICHAFTQDGRCVSLFNGLQTGVEGVHKGRRPLVIGAVVGGYVPKRFVSAYACGNNLHGSLLAC